MDLLPKQEIDKRKAEEKRLDIEQGMKLAKKIDLLREAASVEMANINKFRDAALKNIREELSALESQKAVLISECAEAEEQKRVARVPLDIEWSRVNQAKLEIDTWRDGLGEREEVIAGKELDCDVLAKELELESDRIADAKIAALEKLSEAEKKKSHADIILLEAHEEQRRVKKILDEREQKVARREAEAEVIARDANNQKQANFEHEMNLGQRERALQDQIQMFIRSKNRLNG